jgi:hypothetical protein
MTVLSIDGLERESVESELEDDIRRAVRLARFLDAEFSVMGFRFGFDAVIGLVPGIGDSLGFLAGLYPVHLVRKHNLGKALERRMIFNLLLDCTVGMIPVGGDLFDAMFKANLKNIALLERAVANQKRKVKSRIVR